MKYFFWAVYLLSAILSGFGGSFDGTAIGESISAVMDSEEENTDGKTDTKNVFQVAETTADGLSRFRIWKSSPHGDDIVSETFYTDYEGVPKAALQFDEMICGLRLGNSKSFDESYFEGRDANYTVTPRGSLQLEFYSNGKNAELVVFNTETGSVYLFDIDIAYYNAIAALADELIAYKTPVTYDDTPIKEIVSEDYEEVLVNNGILSQGQFTKKTIKKLMKLLRSCEYTPLPDDVEENFCKAEFHMYKNIGDTDPVMLRLCHLGRIHGSESYDAIAVHRDNREYYYTVTKEKYDEISRLTDWGHNYVM